MEPNVLIVSLLVGVTAMLLTLGVYRTITQPASKRRFEDALSDIHGGELQDIEDSFAENQEEKPSGWMSYWRVKARKAGQQIDSDSAPGLAALRNAAIAGLFGYLVFPQGIIGLVSIPVLALSLQALWLGAQAKKRVATIDKQLPILLSSLRSHLQAGATPQQAIVSVADEIPAPLGDELRIVKKNVSVAMPLDEALRRLSDRVPSRELQFLASSIEVAVRGGTNLEEQLGTIEEVVAQRARVRAKLATAIASVRPTQIAATAAVPIFFINSLRDEQSRDFWFSPNSLIFVVAIIFTTFFGLWGIRILIKRIEAM